MNLPDVNEMYPQDGPEQYAECDFCGEEIYVGDRYIAHVDELLCSDTCLGKQTVKVGLAVWVRAGVEN